MIVSLSGRIPRTKVRIVEESNVYWVVCVEHFTCPPPSVERVRNAESHFARALVGYASPTRPTQLKASEMAAFADIAAEDGTQKRKSGRGLRAWTPACAGVAGNLSADRSLTLPPLPSARL